MTRTHLTILGLTALLLGAAAGVITAPGSSENPGDLNLIAHSAETATATGSARATYDVAMTVPGQGPLVISGDAQLDFHAAAFSLTMHYPPELGVDALEMRFLDGVFYLRMPSGFGTPTPWVSFDVGAAGEPGLVGTGNDVGQTLDYLRGAGDVVEVGPDTVGGVTTTHYRTTIDLAEAVDRAPAGQRDYVRESVEQLETMTGTTELPFDVWVDGDGLPRRLVYTIDVGATDVTGQVPTGVEMTLTMDLFDYGAPVSVTAPPRDDVTDVTDQLELLEGLATA